MNYNSNKLQTFYDGVLNSSSTNPLKYSQRPNTSNAHSSSRKLGGGIPSGNYQFMKQGWIPETNNSTKHYQQHSGAGQTRAANSGIGIRSNRWITSSSNQNQQVNGSFVAAEVNTTYIKNKDTSDKISAEKIKHERLKTQGSAINNRASVKQRDNSLRAILTAGNGTSIVSISSKDGKMMLETQQIPLSTKNLNEGLENEVDFEFMKRKLDKTNTDISYGGDTSLKQRATSASNRGGGGTAKQTIQVINNAANIVSNDNLQFGSQTIDKCGKIRNSAGGILKNNEEGGVLGLKESQKNNIQIENQNNYQDDCQFKIKRRSNTQKENLAITQGVVKQYAVKKAETFILNNTQQTTATSSTLTQIPSLDNYTLHKQLGQGAYASVKLVTHKISQQRYALKIYEKYRLNDPMKKKAVQREIAVLRKMQHPNIVKMIELIENSKNINLVMEFVNGISLQQYVKNCNPQSRKIPETQCRKLFKQIAEGIEYIHSINVCHRDIKLDNILIEEKNNMIKIIDFGFAAFCSQTQKLKIFCGTPSYMAPEIVQKKEYDGKCVDVWALGVLLFAMLTGTFPFRGISESDLYYKIQRGSFKIPEGVSKEAKRVIYKMLEVDYKKRITARELIKDPWVRCQDLPLTVFENVSTLYRGHSVDNRYPNVDKENANELHNKAIDQLKKMGYSGKDIDETLKGTEIKQNNIYELYKQQVDKALMIGSRR